MSDDPNLRVTLIARETDRVTTSLRTSFNYRGDLVLDGHDFGSFVEEMWGREDYEYKLRVKKEDLSRLAQEISVLVRQPSPAEDAQPQYLIDALKKLFAEGEPPARFRSDSEFKKWLDEREIPSEFSSWP